MSEMIQRAAKALQELWGKHERERYERVGSYGQIARDWAPEYAQTALLAALDVTDDEVEAIRADVDVNADYVCEVIGALIKRAQGVSVE